MSLASYVKKSSFLKGVFGSLANVYPNVAGYRRLGLYYDDLISEENPETKEALRRLPQKVMNDRVFRLRTAFQLSLSQAELPQEKWTKNEDDVAYLTPVLEEVQREFAEREAFDTLKGR